MICKNCGELLSLNDTICPECGYPVSQGSNLQYDNEESFPKLDDSTDDDFKYSLSQPLTSETTDDTSESHVTSENSVDTSEPSVTSDDSVDTSEPSVTSDDTVNNSEPSVTSDDTVDTPEPSVTSDDSVDTSEPSLTSDDTVDTSEPSVTSDDTVNNSEPSLTSENTIGTSEPSVTSEDTVDTSEPSATSEATVDTSEPSATSESTITNSDLDSLFGISGSQMELDPSSENNTESVSDTLPKTLEYDNSPKVTTVKSKVFNKRSNTAIYNEYKDKSKRKSKRKKGKDVLAEMNITKGTIVYVIVSAMLILLFILSSFYFAYGKFPFSNKLTTHERLKNFEKTINDNLNEAIDLNTEYEITIEKMIDGEIDKSELEDYLTVYMDKMNGYNSFFINHSFSEYESALFYCNKYALESLNSAKEVLLYSQTNEPEYYNNFNYYAQSGKEYLILAQTELRKVKTIAYPS